MVPRVRILYLLLQPILNHFPFIFIIPVYHHCEAYIYFTPSLTPFHLFMYIITVKLIFFTPSLTPFDLTDFLSPSILSPYYYLYRGSRDSLTTASNTRNTRNTHNTPNTHNTHNTRTQHLSPCPLNNLQPSWRYSYPSLSNSLHFSPNLMMPSPKSIAYAPL